jgi:hypothetical protein
MMAGKQYTR